MHDPETSGASLAQSRQRRHSCNVRSDCSVKTNIAALTCDRWSQPATVFLQIEQTASFRTANTSAVLIHASATPCSGHQESSPTRLSDSAFRRRTASMVRGPEVPAERRMLSGALAWELSRATLSFEHDLRTDVIS
jgi:hypothetical protein